MGKRKKFEQKKQPPKRQPDKKGKAVRTVIVLVFTVIFALLSIQWIEQERILTRQSARINDLTTQYNALVTQISDINREIELAQTPSYIERYLREKLGMIKKGEIMYKVEPQND